MSEIQISAVKMKSGEQMIEVCSPYHPEFVSAAHKLGGRFSREKTAWYFDLRDESRVRSLCRQVYGTDGEESAETTTVRLHLDRLALRAGNALWYGGRCVAYRPHRDAPVRLGEKVVVLSGGFPKRGGSVKYPSLDPEPGTALEVRDVPVNLVEEVEGIQVVDDNMEIKKLRTRKEELEKELADVIARLREFGEEV